MDGLLHRMIIHLEIKIKIQFEWNLKYEALENVTCDMCGWAIQEVVAENTYSTFPVVIADWLFVCFQAEPSSREIKTFWIKRRFH